MSRSTKVTLLVIGLIGVLVLSTKLTGTTPEDLFAKLPGANSEHSTREHDARSTAPGHGRVELPKPLGSPKAPVKIKVYVTTDNECDTTTLKAMKELAQRYGNKVYVEFGDLLDPKTKEQAHKARIGCKTGLTINGQSKFILPNRGLKGTILLDGPVGQKNYNMADIEAVVQYLIQKAEKERAKE